MAERLKILTLARDLKRRRAREREGAFVAEGIRTCEELLASGLSIRGALVGPQLATTERGRRLREALDRRGVQTTEVSERDFASAADTDTPQGVLGIAMIPDRKLAELPDRDSLRFIVLDAIQDPGNVGTILRTAAALGADATIALPGTADIWNAKVVRAAVGTAFRHPVISGDWNDIDPFFRLGRIELWGADASGAPIGRALTAPARLALAVGNEGAGLSDGVRGRAAKLVSLPIAPVVESLNVAIAAGILLYELRPQ